jgi:hypothetical protein
MAKLEDVIQKGTLTTRPAPATIIGALYFSTDNGKIYRGNGTTWDDVTPAGGAVTSLTTTGSSGPATLAGGVLNIPQYSGGGGGGISSSVVNKTVYTSASRAFGTVYQNTSSFPLIVMAKDGNVSGSAIGLTDSSNPPTTQVWSLQTFVAAASPIVFVVMPGDFYKVTGSVFGSWVEYVFNTGTMTASGDLHATKALGTNYQNTGTGFMIVQVVVSGVSDGATISAFSDSTIAPTALVYETTTAGSTLSAFFLVPPGDYYRVTASAGAVANWNEYSSSIAASKSAQLMTSTRSMSIGRGVLNTSGKCRLATIVYSSGSTGSGIITSDTDNCPSFVQCWGLSMSGGRVRGMVALQLPNEFLTAYQDNDTNPTQTAWYEYVLG